MKQTLGILIALLLAGTVLLIAVSANKRRDSNKPWLRFKDERLILVEARIVRQVRDGTNQWGEVITDEEPIRLRFLTRNGAPLSIHLPFPNGTEFSAAFVPWLREDDTFELTELWLEMRSPGMSWESCIDGGGTPLPVPVGEWAMNYSHGHGEPRPVPRYTHQEIEVTILPATNAVPQGIGFAALGNEKLHVTQIAAPDRMTMGVFRYGKPANKTDDKTDAGTP